MKHIITFFIVFQLLFANDLLQEAQHLEQQGKYKEAMLLYKQLATQTSTQNNNLEENIKHVEAPLSDNPANKINIKNGLKHIKNSFETVNDQQTNSTIEQILSSSFDLYPYKENYLFPLSYDFKKRDDRQQTEAKFQISVKKPITYNLLGLDETINFGYTQKSMWQIYSHSSPFRETNYQPEVFVFVPVNYKQIPSLKGHKFGYLHESNGENANSRSWDRIYLEEYFQTQNLFLIPRIWLRIPEKESDDDNPDIEEYLGYGDISILYAYKDHTFKVLLRNNLKMNDNNKGFIEFNWSFPLFGSQNNFGFIQLSSGYGDSLIDYDKEINRASVGISLSR